MFYILILPISLSFVFCHIWVRFVFLYFPFTSILALTNSAHLLLVAVSEPPDRWQWLWDASSLGTLREKSQNHPYTACFAVGPHEHACSAAMSAGAVPSVLSALHTKTHAH